MDENKDFEIEILRKLTHIECSTIDIIDLKKRVRRLELSIIIVAILHIFNIIK